MNHPTNSHLSLTHGVLGFWGFGVRGRGRVRVCRGAVDHRGPVRVRVRVRARVRGRVRVMVSRGAVDHRSPV